MTILAGDLGGTKTVLALYRPDDPIARPTRLEKYVSRDFAGLEPIVETFLAEGGETPAAACFGLAGPIVAGEARITNLPWVVRAELLGRRFGIADVDLLNDVQSVAEAVATFGPEDVHTLNVGTPQPGGTRAVVAPGTGLGIAFMVRVGDRYHAFPTEGGHVSFAPRTHEELELLRFLEARFDHVSFERVCSGSGIPNIYAYLRDAGRYDEPDWLKRQLAEADDPTPMIVTCGIEERAAICDAAVDMFVRILGGVLGNVALMVMATGGLYLGGGIPPRILARLRHPDLLAAVRDKGRFSALCADIPVHVILDPLAGLHGAAAHARARLSDRRPA
jgi:glucokinase